MYVHCKTTLHKRISMLKKLVKYGNSNALVLDKALLELLNITEGAVVKIKTDGTSLIITPHNLEALNNVVSPTITPNDALLQAVNQNNAQYYNNPDKYMDEVKKLYCRYDESIKKLESPEYKDKVLELNQLFKNNKNSSEYGKALSSLTYTYAPGLLNLEQEMEILTKNYSTPELEKFQQMNNNFISSTLKFKNIHEKYAHVRELVAQLHENPDYINESVHLAEKYQLTKNSPEYIQEYNQLIAKFIPEYADYQDEIKKVADSLK